MKIIKQISLSLATITIMSFNGCGGDSATTPSTQTDTQVTKTGYLVDGAIEGLRYVASSGETGTTDVDGKYEFVEGDTVEFYLGNLQLGESIQASQEPITPIELFNEKKEDYKDNTKVVNLLRLLQTLDNDNYHDNGIKIDSATFAKFENISSINLDDETSIQDTLKNNDIEKILVDDSTAKINMDNSLMQIYTGTLSSDNPKVKSFNRYYGAIFELEKKVLDGKRVDAIDSIEQISKLIQGSVDVTTSALDSTDKKTMEVVVNTTKELYKALVGINGDLTSTQLASLNLFVDIVTPLLTGISKPSEIATVLKKELLKSDTMFNTLVAGLGITASLSSDEMANNLTVIVYNLRALMTLANGSVFDASKLIADGIIINADALAKITALTSNTKAMANSIITQEYVRLYYQNGESNTGMINYFKTNDSVKTILENQNATISDNMTQAQIIDTIANISSFKSYTALETSTMFLPWNWWSSELKFDEYDKDLIEDKIATFKTNFESYYSNFEQYRVGIVIEETTQTTNFTYKTITSPTTGKVWMDRNLGASQACTAYNDTACYGDYYQWGRKADGHEKSTSATTSIISTSIFPLHGDYIIGSNKWTSADSDGLTRFSNWNVCPSGFRIPTKAELNAETIEEDVNNRADAFSNFLKLPSAGYRHYNGGSMNNKGSYVNIWSISVDGSNSQQLHFDSSNAKWNSGGRAAGRSVRCIRD